MILHRKTLAAALTASLLALIGLALGSVGGEPAPQAEPQDRPAPVLTVRLVEPRIEEWPEHLSAVGSVLAWQEISIGAETGGLRLARLLVEAGDRVTAGQVVAELAGGTIAADLLASRAALREAEAAAAEARRAADRALALKPGETISASSRDQLLAAAEMATARLEAARARVEADRMRLDFATIRAPHDGLISAVSALEGTVIQPGQELVRLHRDARLEWRADLPAADVPRVRPGMVVRLFLGRGMQAEGRVRSLSPQIDAASRMATAHVDLQPTAGLLAGIFARGEIEIGSRAVLTLPETAVLLRDGYSYVFLVEDGIARMQKVTTGTRRDGRVEIGQGLPPRAQVVESGVGFLADGVAVHVPAPGGTARSGS
ncbi:efflux RND transporter periplasmic adaptor subunit [Paracoccus sp. P2]|uniref:efflux RND transporter periplasmic adaptor subunit n=1 Tax=Paracoccus TaxID=265 RepID=UPI0008E4FD57|nr:efflux RND transporter periplasmic adaptor subunit [Paracoccus pantotrophus]MDF3856532.1 efflux RND transporter periplasmic adaptor subunit [Paracoccus pantotrophus]SFP21841.1 RND family efflux transporter, MFP subunit [Paracoccus pantotrophus]